MMKRQRGFTLIELMLAVATVAILAAVAFPSYQGAVRKSNRGSAQAFMMDVAQREQAMLLDSRSYVAVTTDAAFAGSLGLPIPADVSGRYTVRVAAVAGPPPGFTITATPIAGTNQEPDGILVLNNAGTKTRDGDPGLW